MPPATLTVARGASLLIGTAEYPCGRVEKIDDHVVAVVHPPELGVPSGDLLGEAVRLRWCTQDGVNHADGTLAAIDGSTRWIVRLTSAPRQEERRRFRRVAVQVETDVTFLDRDREVTCRTRSLNLSLGGAALVTPDGCGVVKGDPVVVAIDPIDSRILAGAVVVADPIDAGCLRLRFDSISGACQDLLVAVINRHELRLAR